MVTFKRLRFLPNVTESGHLPGEAEGIRRAYQDGDTVVVELGSGDFESTYDSGQ
jgi:hypothetical protein